MVRMAWLCLLCWFPSYCYALVIEPFVLEMNTTQQGQIIITNPTSSPLAVDTEIFEFQFDDSSLKAVSESLLVYPPAVLLQPGAKQSIRVIWQGRELNQAKSFYIRFTTPTLHSIETSKHNRVNLKVEYNALVHLSSPAAKAQLSVSQTYVEGEYFIVEVQNEGSKYAYLEDLSFQSDHFVFEGHRLAQSIGDIFFPSKAKSKLRIPLSVLPSDYNFNDSLVLTN